MSFPKESLSLGSKFPLKWTAPEAAWKHAFTPQSDVWSYGIVLYEVFTRGGVPYPGYSNKEVVSEIQNGYCMAKPAECPQWVYEHMLQCWQQVLSCALRSLEYFRDLPQYERSSRNSTTQSRHAPMIGEQRESAL